MSGSSRAGKVLTRCEVDEALFDWSQDEIISQ